MSTITTKDGTTIHFEDWGSVRPVVLSHGWPLSADSWESQALHLRSNGFRVVTHDRRGHGRSSQPGMATTWTTTPTIWRNSSRTWPWKTRCSWAFRPVAAGMKRGAACRTQRCKGEHS